MYCGSNFSGLAGLRRRFATQGSVHLLHGPPVGAAGQEASLPRACCPGSACRWLAAWPPGHAAAPWPAAALPSAPRGLLGLPRPGCHTWACQHSGSPQLWQDHCDSPLAQCPTHCQTCPPTRASRPSCGSRQHRMQYSSSSDSSSRAGQAPSRSPCHRLLRQPGCRCPSQVQPLLRLPRMLLRPQRLDGPRAASSPPAPTRLLRAAAGAPGPRLVLHQRRGCWRHCGSGGCGSPAAAGTGAARGDRRTGSRRSSQGSSRAAQPSPPAARAAAARRRRCMKASTPPLATLTPHRRGTCRPRRPRRRNPAARHMVHCCTPDPLVLPKAGVPAV